MHLKSFVILYNLEYIENLKKTIAIVQFSLRSEFGTREEFNKVQYHKLLEILRDSDIAGKDLRAIRNLGILATIRVGKNINFVRDF